MSTTTTTTTTTTRTTQTHTLLQTPSNTIILTGGCQINNDSSSYPIQFLEGNTITSISTIRSMGWKELKWSWDPWSIIAVSPFPRRSLSWSVGEFSRLSLVMSLRGKFFISFVAYYPFLFNKYLKGRCVFLIGHLVNSVKYKSKKASGQSNVFGLVRLKRGLK